MKAIIIDDEPWMLRHFSDECANLDGIELVGSFRNPLTALEFVQNNDIDLAFVDMEMPQLNGAETAKKLREIPGSVKIVFVSAYDESYIDAVHNCSANGYLRKPYQSDDLKAVIEKITAS